MLIKGNCFGLLLNISRLSSGNYKFGASFSDAQSCHRELIEDFDTAVKTSKRGSILGLAWEFSVALASRNNLTTTEILLQRRHPMPSEGKLESDVFNRNDWMNWTVTVSCTCQCYFGIPVLKNKITKRRLSLIIFNLMSIFLTE